MWREAERYSGKAGDAAMSAVRAMQSRVENGSERLETVGLRALCLIYGHEAIPDQCNKPEHDLCAYCQKPMPGTAHGPQY